MTDTFDKEYQKLLPWDVLKSGKKKPTFKNVTIVFDNDPNIRGLFRHNDFSGDIEMHRLPPYATYKTTGDMLTDMDLVKIKAYIVETYNFEPAVSTIQEAIVHAAHEDSFHPIKDYLEALEWDGQARLDTWLIDYGKCIDSEYTRAVARKTLIAACNRVYRPGCKYDYMLVLEGEQDIGKSRLVEALGGEWTTEVSLLGRQKDIVESLLGKWIVEVPELSSFKKQDVNFLKAFLSTRIDRVRLSYRRNAEDLPRKSVFIGTINPEGNGYLCDPTGNRRFYPIEVYEIDVVGLQKNRDQIFAEAYLAYKAGEELYIKDKITRSAAIAEQEKRAFKDVWYDDIAEYLDTVDRATGKQIWVDGLGREEADFNNSHQRRIGNIMRQLGWLHQTIRTGYKIVKGYQKPEKGVTDVPY